MTKTNTVTVLYAHDKHPARVVMSAQFRPHSHVDLVCVEDGAKAVDAWRRRAFDLVILKDFMPVMDGWTAARAIRAAEKTLDRPRTRLFAEAVSVNPEHLHNWRAAGVDLILGYPVPMGQIWQAVTELAALPPNAAPCAARCADPRGE